MPSSAPPPADPRQRFLPWLVLLVLVAAAFLLGFQVPYQVDSDVAFQLKSLDQWRRGDSPTPVTLSLPDPRDLSRSSLLWSRWWLPGFPWLYAPLAATGLPLAAALRLTSLLLFLAGCAGFLRLATRAGLPGWARVLYAVSLAGYGLTLGGATSLKTVDVLTFAAGPWLALLALGQTEGEPRSGRLVLAGLALGATCWVRYPLFLTALPLLAWMILRIVKAGPEVEGPGGRRFQPGSLAALGFGFLLPIALLLTLDLRADDVPAVAGERPAQGAHLPFLALSVAGGPGLGLFQNDHWLTHLTFFSDARVPFFRGLDDTGRLTAKVLLGIPATLALAWALARARRRSSPLAGFALFVTVCFVLELAAVSLIFGYNYLAYEPRRTAGFLPLVQAIVLGEWLAGLRGSPELRPRLRDRAVPALGLLLFFAVPLAFVAAHFLRNEIGDRLDLRYTASSTGLWMPEISQRNVPEVQAAVTSALRSPGDVVVLAGSESWRGYSAFVPWLELPQRSFPVAPFSSPLGTRYSAAANLSGSVPIHSERPLRLVLVLDRTLVADGTLPRLQARFPQARSWAPVPVPAHSEVAVYCSDLQP